MENTLSIVLALAFGAAAAFAIAWFWSRSRMAGEPDGALQAQLAAAREQANRLGVQAAEFEREAMQLRGQLLESVQNAAQMEERTRQLQSRLDEERTQVVGTIAKRVWSAFVTIRGDCIRIISVRRARDEEEKRYFDE